MEQRQIGYIFRKILVLVSYFSDLKWISFDFLDLIRFILFLKKMQNYLQNHSKGQIYPVLAVGWPMLSGFVVEGWKSEFYDSSRGENWTFSFFSKNMV